MLVLNLPFKALMFLTDRKSGSAGMPRPISNAVFCLKKKKAHVASQLSSSHYYVFFFNDTATTEIYTLSLHDALPIFLLVAPCLNCLEAVKKPPPVAFKVMCLLPITIL